MSKTQSNGNESTAQASPYIGRFAPSPSGKLHFGSLVSAVASFCDARARCGKWLLRIEDLDPPREEAGAADAIIASLEAHGLLWDGDIVYQSERLDAYEAAFDQLQTSIYPCNCIRQRIASLGGYYDGHCRDQAPPQGANVAWRVNIEQHPDLWQDSETFDDIFLGRQQRRLSELGDFIVKRKDSLFSYQLAVVTDDLYQGITHIVRGQDLLESTYWQRYLYRLLSNLQEVSQPQLPIYGHTPLALGSDKHKLSKQTKATPINNEAAVSNIVAALTFLRHPPPIELLTNASKSHRQDIRQCTEILNWVCNSWDRSRIPKESSVAPALTDA